MSCHRVSLPGEGGPGHWPGLLTPPVLAENVGQTHITCDVTESNDLGGDGLSDAMAGQRVVPLVQSRTKSSAAVDDRLVVSRHTSITAPATSDGSVTAIDDSMSSGLSQPVSLSPRWLVAAVACVLRHDLGREVKETRRQAAVLSPKQPLRHPSGSYEARLSRPVVAADDACLLWQSKRVTKKAAERAQECSDNMAMTPFEFLQQPLTRVSVPIDLGVTAVAGCASI